MKDTKRPKHPTATFDEPGTKAGYCACPLHTTPPNGWADHLSHSSTLTPGHTPTSNRIRNKLALPPGSEQAMETVVCSHFLLLQQGPHKTSPEFLVWPLIYFYQLRRPRTLIGNTFLSFLALEVEVLDRPAQSESLPDSYSG